MKSYVLISPSINGQYVRVDKISDVVHAPLRHSDVIQDVKKLSNTERRFDFGRKSKGTDQLAITMLMDVTLSKNLTLNLYKQFSKEILEVLDYNSKHTITETDIQNWICMTDTKK